MITIMELGRGRPTKAYKNLSDRMLRAYNNDANSGCVYIGDKKIDVLKSCVFVTGKILRRDYTREIGKRLSIEELDRLNNIVNGGKSSNISLGTGEVEHKQKGLDKNELDALLAATVLADNFNTLALSTVMEVLDENSSLRAEVLGTAGIGAISVLNTKESIIINPFCIHMALIYYWAYKTTDINGIMSVLKEVKLVDKSIALKVDKEESFEEFMHKVYPNKTEYTLAINYIKEAVEFGHSRAFILRSLEFIHAVLDKCKINSTYARWVKMAKNSLNSSDIHTEFKRLLGTQRINHHAALMLVNTAFMPRVLPSWNYESALAFEYIRLFEKGDTESRRYSALEYSLRTYAIIEHNLACMEQHQIVVAGQSQLSDKVLLETKARKSAEAKVEQNQAKYQDIRTKFKEINKEKDRISRELNQSKNEIEKLKTQIEHNISPDAYDEICDKNDRLEDELSSTKEELHRMGRQLSMKDKDIEAISVKLRQSINEQSELKEKLDRQIELSNTLQAHRQFSEIPMECFVKAIYNKRIALLGGNMMHEKLRSYGLDNMRLYEAGCRNIGYEDISDVDLVVIATQFIDHASIEGVVKIAKNHNIPSMRFNNKNADLLIYTIFEELNK